MKRNYFESMICQYLIFHCGDLVVLLLANCNDVQFSLQNKLLSVMFISDMAYAVNIEGFFMGPTQGPYILQLCMGPSYFWGV